MEEMEVGFSHNRGFFKALLLLLTVGGAELVWKDWGRGQVWGRGLTPTLKKNKTKHTNKKRKKQLVLLVSASSFRLVFCPSVRLYILEEKQRSRHFGRIFI